MKSITGWSGMIESPSEIDIESVLREMPGGENSFIILERDQTDFIQAAGGEFVGFSLENQEGGIANHYRYVDLDVTLEKPLKSSIFF